MKLLKYPLANDRGHFVFRAEEFRSALDIEGRQIGTVQIAGQTYISLVGGGQGVGVAPTVTAEKVMQDVQEALKAKEQA